jgi:uncharacterized membrane protein YtjA (UPF0391 family)
MLKYAIVFLIISLIAGALGLTNISQIARRISLVLFALFFLLFLFIVGLILLIGEAIERPVVPAGKVMRDHGGYAFLVEPRAERNPAVPVSPWLPT